jgi:hypothetical protein
MFLDMVLRHGELGAHRCGRACWLGSSSRAGLGTLAIHGAPVAFNRGIVRGDELCGDHSFYFVFRLDLTITLILVGMLEPERLNRLVGKNVIPTIGLRSSDAFQRALPVFHDFFRGTRSTARRRGALFRGRIDAATRSRSEGLRMLSASALRTRLTVAVR